MRHHPRVLVADDDPDTAGSLAELLDLLGFEARAASTPLDALRLVTLVTAVAARLGVAEARAPELAELARDVAPEKVLDRLQAHEAAPGPPSR